MEEQGERDDGAAHTSSAELVMVAFCGQPDARWIIRTGWRLARGLKAQLLAVAVTPPGTLAACDKDSALAEARRLAEDLGAEVVCVEGSDVALALATLATERHVTQIVIGQPAPRPWWRELFHPSVTRRLSTCGSAPISTSCSGTMGAREQILRAHTYEHIRIEYG